MAPFFCRSRKRMLCLIVFCMAIPAVFLLILLSSFNETIAFSEKCKNVYADSFMTELCTNYSSKRAYGNLCSSLCEGGNFKRQGCIKHSDTIVIDGTIEARKIVVKWKKPKWPDESTVKYMKGILHHDGRRGKDYHQKNVWKNLVFNRLKDVVGKAFDQRSAIEKEEILKNLKTPSLENANMAASFLSLVENDEYAMLGTFQELLHLPQLYGYCGQAYVMEKLTPYGNIFPALVHELDWKKAAKLALSFLDMVIELETAVGGPLRHCDIQEGNFGITDDFEIKLIDIDLVLTKEKADMLLPQPNCTSNSDCEFFDCVTMCDVKRGKCLAKLITSNFQVLCRDIFKSQWPSTGLFGNMPSSIHQRVTAMLNDCASVQFGFLPFNHQRVQTLIRNLKLILLNSLKPS